VILPIVQAQFTAQPSVMPAFMRLTRELRSSVEANTLRRAELASLDVPVRLIWGADDPYLNRGVAEHFEALLPSVESSLLPLGHWPQVDDPGAVAGRLLELPMRARTRLAGEK
jgi:haloalkane dehalogenase